MKLISTRSLRAVLGALALLFALAPDEASAAPLMTYQGRLKESGLPVSGNRDIDVLLCNCLSGLCAPACASSGVQGVVVGSGLFRTTFTVPASVDLGASQQWFLEVQVQGTPLVPREALTAGPYAVIASTAFGLAAAPGAAGVTISSNIFLSGTAVYALNSLTILNSVPDSASSMTIRAAMGTGLTGGGVSINAGNYNGGSNNAVGGPITLTAGALNSITGGFNMIGGDVTINGGANNSAMGNATSGSVILNSGASPVAKGSLLFKIAGVEKMRLADPGNVGIGTTNPASKLHVLDGDIRVSTTIGSRGIIFQDGSVQATAAGPSVWATNAPHIYNANAGNVGIGTTSPGSRLTVQGPESSRGLRITDGTNNSNIVIQPLDGGNSGFQAINFNGFRDFSEQRFNVGKNRWRLIVNQAGTSDLLYIDTFDGTASNNLFSMTTGGNVGIGTIAPAATLHVSSAATAAATPIFIVSSGTAVGQELLRVSKDGNVGIGTTAPQATLEVQNNSTALPAAIFRMLNSGGWVPAQFINSNGGQTIVTVVRDYGTTLTNYDRMALFVNSAEAGLYTDKGGTGVNLPISIRPAGVEAMRFAVGGNVGIGTTSPAQKLHVEGQCVTGDTLILARRAAAARPYFEETPIVNLKAGDLVMSLNEASGRIEPHRVNGLLDMGVKPVFRLKTASGRTIRTTGNHPYLTRSGWRRIVEIKVGEEIAVPQASAVDVLSGTDARHQDAITKPVEDKSEGAYAIAIDLTRHAFDLFGVMKRLWRSQYGLEFLDDAPLVGFRQISQLAVRMDREVIGQSPSRRSMVLPETRPDLRDLSSLTANPGLSASMSSSSSSKASASRNSPTALVFLSTSLTTPLRYLEGWARNRDRDTTSSRNNREGIIASNYNRNAGAVQWDRVVAIETLGQEPVWDIEVEGTHNFIGNRIFAHNTYLSGNVGIGTTNPLAKLHLDASAGNILRVDYLGAPKFFIESTGNVGIGTTGPLARLHVTGAGGGTAPLIVETASFAERFRINAEGRIEVSGPPPTLVACTGGAFLGPSNDVVGKINFGAAAGGLSCGMNFTTPAWLNPPVCVVSLDGPTITAIGANTTFTGVTFVKAASYVNGDTISYYCIGRR